MTDSAQRVIALIELWLLLACGTHLHLQVRQVVPAMYWIAGWAYGALVLGGAVAMGINLASAESLSSGAQTFAFILHAVTGVVLGVTAVVVFRSHRRA